MWGQGFRRHVCIHVYIYTQHCSINVIYVYMYTFIHICTYIYSYITPFKTLHKYNATSLYNSKYSKNKICTCIHTCRYIYSIVQNIYNATLLQLYVNPHSKCGQIMSRVHETDMLLRLRTRSMPVLTQNYSRSFV